MKSEGSANLQAGSEVLPPATADFTREPLRTAVLFVVFNRPETTQVVFEAIREAKPPRLYVAADGPRRNHAGEDLKVEAVRRYVTENVDWECEVRTHFQEENLGCKFGVGAAITWFFEHEEAGIILEDDCLPDQSFFYFCEELLDRYQDDEQVMHVAGSCLMKDVGARESYFFSKYPAVWGWATWRDAWSRFSLTTDDFESDFEAISAQFPSVEEREYWRSTLKDYFDGRIDTWDYSWAFSIWKQHGLATYPTRNLVKNIGFGVGSTHTKAWKDHRGLGDAELQPLDAIVHPQNVVSNPELDQKVFDESYKKSSKMVIGFKLLRRLVAKSVRGSRSPK